jgi:YD repeat-containing protein
MHRPTSVTNANSETTSFTYDAVGNRLTLTDPEANTTEWEYDPLNRVIAETNELSDTRVRRPPAKRPRKVVASRKAVL